MSTGGTLSNYIGANLVFTAIFLVLTLEATRRGLWVLAVPAAWIIGTILLIALYPRLKVFFEAGQTLHQALGSALDGSNLGWKGARRWASLATIFAFVGGVSLEFYGGIHLLRWGGFSQLYVGTIAALLAFTCGVFTALGGLRGVAKVNYFLDSMSAVGIGILFYYIIKAWSSHAVAAAKIQHSVLPTPSLTDNLVFVVAGILLFAPIQICALDTWQRGVGWKERTNVKGPLLFGAACIALMSSISVVAGITIRSMSLKVAAGSHPLFALLSQLHIPTPFVGLMVAGFIATILSTADELLNCCGYAVLADFLVLPRSATSAEQNASYVRSGKLYTGIFALISAIVAVLTIALEKQVTDVATVAFSTQVVFLFPILIALFSKNGYRWRVPALIAMLVSFATALFFVVGSWGVKKPEDAQAMVDSAPLAAFLLSSLIIGASWLILRRTKVGSNV
jgi:hypothetical protein